MEIIIATILWFILIIALAIFEAHYYDYVYFQDRDHKNLHPLLVVIRFMFLLPLMWSLYYTREVYECLIFGFSLCFMIPFIHDGTLYTMRNILTPEIYKKKWFSNREKSEIVDKNKANISLPFYFRLAMFIIGLIFVVGLILQYKI